jgi:hypothetical protein
MRPERFNHLLTAAAQKAGADARTLDEAGHTDHRYGVAMRAGSGQVWWSFTAAGAPGDKYSEPEAAPVSGPRPEPVTAPALGPKVTIADLEIALASALLELDEHAEIATIDRYSTRENPGAIPYGLTIGFHSGARIYLNGLATIRQGEDRPGRLYELADAV